MPKPPLWPKLHISKKEIIEHTIAFSLCRQKPTIGFCPGAEFGPAKRWPHYHFAALAQQLIDHGYQVVLLGSIKDCVIAEHICKALPVYNSNYCINLAGKTTLDQAAILIAACQVIVSNDSGLMHIADALNKPRIALYGPTDPGFTPRYLIR